MLIRLDPFMFLLTPLGVAEAHFLLAETSEVPYQWGCFQCETKENWWWPNDQVRIIESVSASRSAAHSPIHLSDEKLETLKPHIARHFYSPFNAA
jgi:hypothetical protein